MRPQTSPLLTLVTVVIAGAILFLIVCAGVYLIVNPFRAAPTTTAAANQPTVVVTQVVVITTTPAPTKAITPTGRPSPTNTALSTITPTDTPTWTNTPTLTSTPTLTKTPTDTPTPTTPAPPTNTPTATPLPPTPTPRPTLDPNAPLSSVNVSNQSGATGIRVNIRYADGSPAQGKYVKVWKQKQDVSGNPIVGDGVTDGRTDNTGSITFGLNPDTYVVGVGDIAGYPYGNVFNYQVTPNSLLVLDVQLGRMIIGIKNADGQPLNGRYTSISLQKPDISGNPVQSDRVADGRTDNTGAIVYDLTAGDYWVDIRDIAGYYWGNPTNWRVKSGETVKIILDLGRIRVGIKNADGRALEGKYVAVSVQKQDIDGKPIPGDRVSDGRTDNTGIIDFDLTPGNYAVYIGDIAGAPYGEQLNHVVEGAKTTSIIVTLGRVTVGLKDESGNPARGRYVALYAQQTDVAGNIIRGDRLIDGRTDDTGLLNLDITAGHYVMEIEGFALQNDVNVESGHVTFSDGNGFQVR